jgi:mRNA interferase YafQ
MPTRKTEAATRFRRDYRRAAKTYGLATLDSWFVPVLRLLCTDTPLPEKYADHSMTGEWKEYRDCHIKPDLVLIYQKPGSGTLRLVRLGSHAELSL